MEEADAIKINEWYNDAVDCKISIGEFVRKAEEYLGVLLPRVHGINEGFGREVEKYDEAVKKSGLIPEEWSNRVSIIMKVEESLYANRINEKYAEVHGLSGRLTV